MSTEIEIIKSKKSLIDRARAKHFDKLRVAAYCRVSTNSDEQLSSYKSQVSYYRQLISKNEDWIFVDIYADEAITGTNVDKREDFRRLINDCMNGTIDLIITKSISRFARNTLDTLKYVRMLKEKNIAVMFEDEKINTLTMDGELLLVVLSSVAQQEVENISANVKKGLKMKMQRGEIVGYNGCLGYDYHPENKSITVNEAEAEIVRYIFNRYVEGAGGGIIARELRNMGAISKRGCTTWHESTVRGIIKNEKYIGDILMGKTFTVDPISKRRLVNMGEEDKVYMREHHEPIVTKAIFYKAQEIMKQRSGSKVLGEAFNRIKYSRQFAFSCMLKCGFCGNSLSRRAWNSGSQYGKTIWHCVAHTNKGSRYCPHSKGIDEKVLEDAFLESYKYLSKDNVNVLDEFLGRITTVLSNNKKKSTIIDKLKAEQNSLNVRKSKLVDSMLDGLIDKSTYDTKLNEIAESLQEIDYQIKANTSDIVEAADYEERLNKFRTILTDSSIVDEFDRALFESVVQCVIVGGYDESNNPDPSILTIVYKSGINDKNQLLDEVKKERIIVSSKYTDEMDNTAVDRTFDKTELLPEFCEVFNFEVPYQHYVFNKNEQGVIQKRLKNDCQVRVAIAI